MAQQRHRTITATELLQFLQTTIRNIRLFFKYDRSLLLSKFRLQSDDDPRLVSLLGTLEQEDAWVAQLRRLLISKYLAIGEEKWKQMHGLPDNDDLLPSHYRHGYDFLRTVGLWEDRAFVSAGLRQGRRCRRFEIAIGNEGISFALLPVFSRLSHLTREEEDDIIYELQSGRYEDVQQLGSDLSELARDSQQWFNHEINVLLPIELSQLFLL
jgi:hypothetical protein